jgi:hypothetical protein
MDVSRDVQAGDVAEAAEFAQRILQIINQGSLTSTYKLALLMALMDVCMERVAVDEQQPIKVDVLASKIVDLYWQQTLPYPGHGEVLRQSGTAGQAKIVSLIQQFRAHLEQGQPLNASPAKIVDPEGYDRLVRAIEHQLYRWVLLKLQTVGGVSDLFIYELPSGLTRAARVPAPVRGWTATEAWGRGPPGQIRALVAPAHPATLGAARGRSLRANTMVHPRVRPRGLPGCGWWMFDAGMARTPCQRTRRVLSHTA